MPPLPRKIKTHRVKREHPAADGDEQMEDDGQEKKAVNKKVYVPGKSRTLKEGEELVYDPKAYLLLHTFETDYPCLSFDILPDALGDNRTRFPMTAWLSTGTQANKAKDNQLLVMRLSNMNANKKAMEAKAKEQERMDKKEEDESSSSSSSDEEESSEDEAGNAEERTTSAKQPRMHAALIPHYGGVNRIKCHRLGPSDVCAVWNDQQKVQIWNLNPCVAAVDQIPTNSPSKWEKLEKEKPLFTYAGHSAEGFALAWNSLQIGTLASGDAHKKIFLWRMAEGGQWLIDQRPLSDHDGSVEDLAWSPTDESLLLSCSSDRTIRLWDVRAPSKQACVCTVPDAHKTDVNVLSWNSGSDQLIVSGGDDGLLRIWPMKALQYKKWVAEFCHHQKPITTVEWSPHDGTVFMASGEDDQTTIWDLALEEDEPTGNGEEANQNEEMMEEDGAERKEKQQLPPQLLFIHMGQKEVKEVHWHRQCPGLAFTTAIDGFHAFKTINA